LGGGSRVGLRGRLMQYYNRELGDLEQRVQELRVASRAVSRIRHKYPELLPFVTEAHHRALLRYYEEVHKAGCSHTFVASHHVDIVNCTRCGKTEVGDH